jgi:hypothetical protein
MPSPSIVDRETRQWAEAVLLLQVSWLGARLAGAWLDHGCKWVGGWSGLPTVLAPGDLYMALIISYWLSSLSGTLWHPLALSDHLWPSLAISSHLRPSPTLSLTLSNHHLCTCGCTVRPWLARHTSCVSVWFTLGGTLPLMFPEPLRCCFQVDCTAALWPLHSALCTLLTSPFGNAKYHCPHAQSEHVSPHALVLCSCASFPTASVWQC